MLVEYIEENSTEEDPWVIIKHRDVPDLTGSSPYYTNKIFEHLKQLNTITYRTAAEHNTKKKPVKFMIIDPADKPTEVFSEKEYAYIQPHQMSYLQLRLIDEDTLQIEKMLKVMNYLLGKKTPLMEKWSNLKDVLAIDERDLKEIIMILCEIEAIEKMPQEKGPEYVSLQVIIPEKGTAYKDRTLKDKKNEDNTNDSNGLSVKDYGDLIQNMKSFSGLIEDFKTFIDSKTDHVIDRVNNIENSRETVEKLIDETKALKEEIFKIENENKKLEKENKMLVEYRNNYEANAQEVLEIMLATMMNSVSNYVQIPHWSKDEKTNAKLQKEISTAVTEAIEKIINN